MKKWKSGDRVQSGEVGTDDHDVGTVRRVRESGKVLVEWEVAETEYWEDPDDLRPADETKGA